MAADDGLAALKKIKHIVVVMMENRSFDHMLGYLTTDGMPRVRGLTGTESNPTPDGDKITVTKFDADAHRVQRSGEALQKKLDPDHSKQGVVRQINGGQMDGFVTEYVATRKPSDNVGRDLWMVPMGYYTAKDVPVYNHLARTYCVCDAWHSSVPGDTWPNRLYAMAGRETAKSDLSTIDELSDLPAHLIKALAGAPIFAVEAFTRQLSDRQWRWYSHDPATLRAADAHYRQFTSIKRDNFGFFDRKEMSLRTKIGEAAIVGRDSFLDDAVNGKLRQVSWIDPNFIDLSILDPNSNDDHPPSDIRAGQAFILDVYEALRRSPGWDDTLLVIAYDEHGGFYDHVAPPAVDDDSGYATLGIRVPALLVGPRVKRGVCHEVFQHTSLINTILTRFAANPKQAIANMPPRVASSRHFGVALADEPRANIRQPVNARAAIEAWRTAARQRRESSGAGVRSVAPDGAGQPFKLHDFQTEFVKFALAMRRAGLPSGQP